VDSELMRYANGEVKPSLQDRRRAARARDIRNEIQEADFWVRGIGALTQDAMEVVSELDDHRDKLAKGDPAKNTLLAQLELDAVQQIREIIADVGPRSGRRLSWLSSSPS
jgi:hypothetical protein